MANLKLVYPSGSATQITYNAIQNYDYNAETGYLETDDHARALDGTLNSYTGARKKTFNLTFTSVLKTQYDYFKTLWTYQCPIDLYLDGTNLDASVKIMNPPSGSVDDLFISGEPTWSFSVNFEEV
jgi:hypothetical protein